MSFYESVGAIFGGNFGGAKMKRQQSRAHRTELIFRDECGKVVFHSEEPRIMSDEEIREECDKWCVPSELVTVNFK